LQEWACILWCPNVAVLLMGENFCEVLWVLRETVSTHREPSCSAASPPPLPDGCFFTAGAMRSLSSGQPTSQCRRTQPTLMMDLHGVLRYLSCGWQHWREVLAGFLVFTDSVAFDSCRRNRQE